MRGESPRRHSSWWVIAVPTALVLLVVTGVSVDDLARAHASSVPIPAIKALADIDAVAATGNVEGAGTGIVLSASGEVLTNNHVIEGASSIRVTDEGNHRAYRAIVVGYDRSQDIAVLQLANASGLTTANLGTSTNVARGEKIVAAGNAEGAGGTPHLARGQVLSTRQSIIAENQIRGSSERLRGLIEVNAAVVPGYSGGALLDGNGEVIGMVTAGWKNFQSQSVSTSGYAIPINSALTVAQLIEAGRASTTIHVGHTPSMGVAVGMPIRGTGAQITATVTRGPAARAGLRVADTITSLDGQPVRSPEGLTEALLLEMPGTAVQVNYLDPSGTVHTATVVLWNGPPL